MPADISERELVDQIQRGDKEAFRGLYDRYARLVYRYVMVRLGTSQDAEDLTSETFIRFWQNVRSFQWREIQVGAWLFRTAHNLIVEYSSELRRRLLAGEPVRVQALAGPPVP